MKKFLSLIALVGIMASCNNKKEEKTDVKTDSTATVPADDKMNDGSVKANEGVPTFSDPEVQQFANDYAAFVEAYKNGMNDPSKMAELSKSMQDWGNKVTNISTKLANNPDEARKWAEWVAELNKKLMPANK